MSHTLTAYCKDGNGNTVTIEGEIGCKAGFIDSLHRSFPHLEIITVLSDDELTFIQKGVAKQGQLWDKYCHCI